ncbi:MAG: quinone-dependent dihydroorotate dehydrogenase, partial [Burkholderiaceae bacterium]
IAPDLADAAIPEVADTLVEHGIDAVIATNTTTTRDRVTGLLHAEEPGGLSGRPLTERATAVIDILARHLKGAVPIIGVGGIMKGEDAIEKIQAGASLVQVYTGFIYSGPDIVAECVAAIRAMKAEPSRTARGGGAQRAA